MVPEVAVTVTVEVVACFEDPPHPESMPKPTAVTASASMICTLRRFLNPKKQRAIANVASGNNGLELWGTAAVVEMLVIVTVVEAAPDVGVTVAGLKAHVAPVGSPEHANVTALLKPFCGVTVRLNVPDVPEVTRGVNHQIFHRNQSGFSPHEILRLLSPGPGPTKKSDARKQEPQPTGAQPLIGSIS